MALLQITEPGQAVDPHSRKRSAGIDLGTTNSLIAAVRAGEAVTLPDDQGEHLLPSAVRYLADDLQVGRQALAAASQDPMNTILSVKRMMGRGMADIAASASHLPYEFADSTSEQEPTTASSGRQANAVSSGQQPSTALTELQPNQALGGRQDSQSTTADLKSSDIPRLKTVQGEVTPMEVSAEILKVLSSRASDQLAGELDGVVITVPAYFDDAQRQATRDAARLAGLEVLRLVNEPTAAAIAYGLDTGHEGVIAVYDLGGGTFDISLLRLRQGVFEVIATGGNSALGGDDFDQAVAQWLIDESGFTGKLSQTQLRSLLIYSRQIKEQLCNIGSDHPHANPKQNYNQNQFAQTNMDETGGFETQHQSLQPSTNIDQVVEEKSEQKTANNTAATDIGPALDILHDGIRVNFTQDDFSVHASLTRETFNNLIKPLVDQTILACRRALLDAGLDASEVDQVVMVGGSTRVPMVREAVADCFGTTPLTNIDPDRVVALGAARQANVLVGNKTDDEMLLLDVLPLSLGLETLGGLTEKIIQRNTAIPLAKAKEFTTYKDGQTAMLIHVVQGERELVADCRSLARFELKGIPPMVAGAAKIEVTFQVDADGLLSVTARELSTGVNASVEVRPSYGLSDEEVTRMLKESFDYAQADATERTLGEARVEAGRVLNALGTALEEDGAKLLTEADIALLREAMAKLSALAEGEDASDIQDGVEMLSKASEEFAALRMDAAVRRALAGKKVEEV